MGKIHEQVGEYLNYCEKVRGMSRTTMISKRNVLERFILRSEIRDIRGLTNEVFNKWVSFELERGVSARSLNTYNAVILAMVRYFLGVGVMVPIKLGLVGKVKEGKVRRRFYSVSEIETAISYADFETGLMIRIMFETGMRIAELTRLRLSDFSGRRIRFIGKGRKQREVYIRADTLLSLDDYVEEYGISDYVWGGLANNGEPPSVNTIRNRLKKVFFEAGFSDFYPHSLRHSFATNLQLKGASVEEIKEMIGHESIATTERYLHGFEGKLEELFEKYE